MDWWSCINTNCSTTYRYGNLKFDRAGQQSDYTDGKIFCTFCHYCQNVIISEVKTSRKVTNKPSTSASYIR